MNRHFARFEQVRRYAVLPHDFTTEGGVPTPTLKLRREAVEEKSRALVDEPCADAAANAEDRNAGQQKKTPHPGVG